MTTIERTPERWFEICVGIHVRDLDAATGLLAGAGYTGCEILEHDAERGEMRLHVRGDSVDDAHARAGEIERTLRRLDAGEPAVSEIDERVWREDWKRHFRRTRIGRRLEILPPWETAPAASSNESNRDNGADSQIDERISIVINPGLAFGTGQHETTAGCLEFLEKVMGAGASVVDVGCGSGILAIAAAKLGASRVLAIDNDPEAVTSAEENCVLNEIAGLVDVRLAQGPPRGELFDVAVANILAETLAEMAAPLTSCVKPDGVLVLSGIESERRRLVEVAFNAEGWRLAHAIERSGWATLAFERRRGEGT